MSRSNSEFLAANIFLKAAEYIRRYGWQIEGMGQHGSPRCSMGALASAYPIEKWGTTLSQLMYSSLYKELHGITLTEFNHKYKHGEKVARLYERVARQLTKDLPVSLNFFSKDRPFSQ